MTDSLLLQIQMSEHNSLLCGGELYMTIFSSFSANFPHITMPSRQLTVSMHQIGSLIGNKHDKLMVKITILFLSYCAYIFLKILVVIF